MFFLHLHIIKTVLLVGTVRRDIRTQCIYTAHKVLQGNILLEGEFWITPGYNVSPEVITNEQHLLGPSVFTVSYYSSIR